MSIPDGFKVSEVGVIPVDWEVKPVGEAFEICNNLRYPISEEVRKKKVGDYPYYGPTKIQGYIDEYRIEGKYALIGEDGDHFLKWRDLPMTLLVSGKFNVNNHAHLVKGTKNLTEWFYYYFYHKEITRHLTRQGAGRYKLTKNTLVQILCAIPPLAEQKAIAQSLSDVDNLITAIDKLITKKRNIKQGTMQELLTGKKRLPGFSGEWEVKKLGDVADIDSDNLRSDTNPNYCFKYISLEDVEMGKLSDVSYCVFSSAPSRARRKVQKNDILVATVRPNLKSHLFVKFEVNDLICSTGFSVIRCNLDNFQPEFIYYHFFASIIDQQINTLLVGSNYPAINSSDIKSLKIPIPPLPEQKAIAKILTEMDEEIEALEKKREKYKNIKQGMMQELLTGKTRIIDN